MKGADGRTLDEHFRENYGVDHPSKKLENKGRFSIEMVGVWDTVASVGLPFENMTQALMAFWRKVSQFRLFRWATFCQLCLYRPCGPSNTWRDWEEDDDLHPQIKNAFHALSVDDERQAFRPVLWLEHKQKDNSSVRKDVNVQQVWFSGMHANVGGGYPKDQLAHVSLKWMMHHASRHGLEFKETLWGDVEDQCDPNGRMYNSRSGFGIYYRYQPRFIEEFSAEVGLMRTPEDLPLIHASVFERIKTLDGSYAPLGIPAPRRYREVETPRRDPEASKSIRASLKTLSARRTVRMATSSEATWRRRATVNSLAPNASGIRAETALRTQGFIRLRRICYYVLFLTTLAFLLTGLFGTQPGKLASLETYLFGCIANLLDFVRSIPESFASEEFRPIVGAVFNDIVLITVFGLLAVLAPLGIFSWRASKLDVNRVNVAQRPIVSVVSICILVLICSFLVRPLANFALTALVPVAGEKLIGVMSSPAYFAIFAAMFMLTYRFNSEFRTRIHEWNTYMWRVSTGIQDVKPPPSGKLTRLADFASVRGRVVNWLDRFIVPAVAVLILVCLIAYPVWLTVSDTLVRARVVDAPASTVSGFSSQFVAAFNLGTDEVINTQLNVKPNTMYVVSFSNHDWQDSTIDAGKTGVDESAENVFMKLMAPLKRQAGGRYFSMCGCVGSPTATPFEIVDGVPFSVSKPGILYLFVNDVPGMYFNNKGHINGCIQVVRYPSPAKPVELESGKPAKATPLQP